MSFNFNRLKIAHIVLLICIISTINAQVINLPQKWLFKTGDNSSYKELNYNDKSWNSIPVPSMWEDRGFANYDGFAWYRVHFNVNKIDQNKDLYLLAGTIDDADETYLNGTLLGSNGKLPPNPESQWNKQRIYKIPDYLLKDENVLAIRVYDMGMGGGIVGGTIGIFDRAGYEKELDLGPPPKKSFHQIVTSNGLIAAVYNEKTNMFEGVYPHIFQAYDENKKVQPFIRNLRLNIDEKPLAISYLKNTHIIDIKYKDFEVNYFASFTLNNKVFFAVIKGNKNAVDKLDFSFDNSYCEILHEEKEFGTNDSSKKYFLFSFNDTLQKNFRIIRNLRKDLSSDLNNNEVEFMLSIFKKSYIPKGLSDSERNLYEQSIAVLKMAQVTDNEIFEKAKGQILASLPPGGWNIAWVRDGMYSILAFNKLGLFTEAKKALSFYLNADAGYYKHYIYKDGIDYGVKYDYKISVCRYFGMGKEESDFNENGPNIELDGFGLFLNSFCDYINKSGDSDFFKQNYDILTKEIADPIINSISKNNLIRQESGPWEEHLPGKQFAYTSIANSAGLNALAELCRKFNCDSSEKYEDASNLILKGMEQNLFYQDELVKGYDEADSLKSPGFFDGGTFELFNFDLNKSISFFDSQWNAYSKNLRINNDRGFSRLNRDDWYSISEWPFIDLRVAGACIKFGKTSQAKKLIDWITAQSKFNHNLIAELYDYETSNYGGATPMVGFGAGAYIITLCEYFSK